MTFNWALARLASGVLLFALSAVVLLIYEGGESIQKIDRRLSIAHIPGNVTDLAADPLLQHKNAYQLDPPPLQNPIGAVVSAARGTENLSWMEIVKQNWTIYPYDLSNTNNSDTRLRVPEDKGGEPMVHLSWIIDNSESLPWCAAFVRSHSKAWHQANSIIRPLHDLKPMALARAGYVPLRCGWYPAFPPIGRPIAHAAVAWGPEVNRELAEAAIEEDWRSLFRAEELPVTMASQSCGQFAVTHQAILRRPKGDYERLRTWLLETLNEDDISGRVFEKLWAYIFTGEAVHCPPPQQCACVCFGRCDAKG